MKATAPITKKQIAEAQTFVEENGYVESFNRRFANIDDIKVSVNMYILLLCSICTSLYPFSPKCFLSKTKGDNSFNKLLFPLPFVPKIKFVFFVGVNIISFILFKNNRL